MGVLDPWLKMEGASVKGPLPVKVNVSRAADFDGYIVTCELVTKERDCGKVVPVFLKEHIDNPREWTEAEALQKVYALCHQLYDHELAEQFTYKGVRPYDPHRDAK